MPAAAASYAVDPAPGPKSGRLGRCRNKRSSTIARAATIASRLARSTFWSSVTAATQPSISATENALSVATASPNASPEPCPALRLNRPPGATKPVLARTVCPSKGSNAGSAAISATPAPSASRLDWAAARYPRSIPKNAPAAAPALRLARSAQSAFASRRPLRC